MDKKERESVSMSEACYTGMQVVSISSRLAHDLLGLEVSSSAFQTELLMILQT